MTTPTEFSNLFRKYIDGTASAEETQAFLIMADQPEKLEELKQLVDEEMKVRPTERLDASEKQTILSNIYALAVKEEEPVYRRRLWPRIAAAASILVACSIGGYFLLHKDTNPQIAQVQHEQIAPNQSGVVLTLANGQKISLNQKHNGKINTGDGAHVEEEENKLAYNDSKDESAGNTEPATHTLTNNSGSKYSLVLADGTEAYLDAQSSITYPVAFTKKERKVSITGQAYFKVKHNADQPFFVTAGNETIEDIGTEFNINAYADEASLKTTLVEGSVKINNTLTLKPGEQSLFNDSELKVVKADMEAATSWLQGKLVFHHEPLESILRKVARIYDVQFTWEDEALKHQTFGGSVSRTKKLATVLNFFRKTGEVDFLVEGKTVKVFKRKTKA